MPLNIRREEVNCLAGRWRVTKTEAMRSAFQSKIGLLDKEKS